MQDKSRIRGAGWSYQLVFFIFLLLPIKSLCQSAEDFLKADMAELTVPEITESLSPSIVTIFVYNATGTVIGQGSGFFVTYNGAILTNAHVVKDAYSALVIAETDTFRLVTVWLRDKERDLALISIPTRDSTIPAVLAESTVFRPGTRVVAIGNPLGLEKTVSDGLISAIRTVNGVELIQITAPISPGSSGGPLLDMFGQVIGVTTSTFQEGQNLNFAVSINTILNFIYDGIKQKEQLKWAGETVWYKVVIKWVANIFIWVFGLIFGGAYYVVLIVVFAIYLLYLFFQGIYKVITYPFRKAKERREAEAYRQSVISSYPRFPKDSESFDDLPPVDASSEEKEGKVEVDFPITIYCWKCGGKLTLPESARGQLIECQSCHTLVKIPIA